MTPYSLHFPPQVSRAKTKLEDLERERQEASDRGTNLANKSKRLMQSILSLQEQAFEAVKRGDEEVRPVFPGLFFFGSFLLLHPFPIDSHDPQYVKQHAFFVRLRS